MAFTAITYWVIEGEEIVYDFETMERSRFRFREAFIPTGICSSLVDFTLSPYFSIIYGFDQEGIIGDWEGEVITGQIGFDIPILEVIAIGGGLAPFFSVSPGTSVPNLDVFGMDVYGEVSLGVSLPVIWFGVFTIDTFEDGGYESYGDNIEKMKQDIQTGDNSPGFLITFRKEAAKWAQDYYEKYH